MKFLNKKYSAFFALITFVLILLISSCTSETGVPKPRTYPRVEFPKKEYQKFESKSCGFSFEYPVYSIIVNDKTYFNSKAPNDCWHNIIFKDFNGTLFLTYYPVNKKQDLDKYINESYELVSMHDIKATGRKEKVIKEKNKGGILFKIEGNVATETQFFLTDSSKNFIRGSLYFNNKVNPDSMAIIQKFIDQDIENLISTFKWTK